MDGSKHHLIIRGSRRYARAFNELLGIEGGFVDDPVDRGGATKYGISLRFLIAEGSIDRDANGFADYDLDMDGDIDGRDIRRLTLDDAFRLYKECFWDRLDCESFPEPVGEMMFDQGVNGGLHAARVLLQRALNQLLAETRRNTLLVDGKVGEKTRRALDTVLRCPLLGMTAFVEAYRYAVKQRYHAIVRSNPSQRRFLKGWLNRADRLGA